ncbi:PEP-CTERM sorting domain-containing protein, partial [Planctomycetota bacterium]
MLRKTGVNVRNYFPSTRLVRRRQKPDWRIRSLASQLAICGICLLLTVASAPAQTLLSANFDDSDLAGWTNIDSTIGQPWGPADFFVEGGELRLEGGGEVPPGVPGGGFIGSMWDASVDNPLYSDGFFRGRIRADEQSTFTGLVMRLTGSVQTGFNGYLFAASELFHDFTIQRFENSVGGPQVSLDVAQFSFLLEEDWMIEAGAVGDELSLKVWRPDDPEPEFPQLTMTDSTYTHGVIGVEANVDVSSDRGQRVGAFFDDLSFRTTIGDFNGDGVHDVEDIDQLTSIAADRSNLPDFDLNNDASVDRADIDVWIHDIYGSWIGDANLDGEFNSSDLTRVFQAAKFESNEPSTWSEGDWTGDGRFGSADFIAAFQEGGYEQGPIQGANVVPEPTSALLLAIGIIVIGLCRPDTPKVSGTNGTVVESLARNNSIDTG